MFDADLIHRRQLLCSSAATLGPIIILVATLPLFVEEPAFVSSLQRDWRYKPASIPKDEPETKERIIPCPVADVGPPALIHRVEFEYNNRLRVTVGVAIFQAPHHEARFRSRH